MLLLQLACNTCPDGDRVVVLSRTGELYAPTTEGLLREWRDWTGERTCIDQVDIVDEIAGPGETLGRYENHHVEILPQPAYAATLRHELCHGADRRLRLSSKRDLFPGVAKQGNPNYPTRSDRAEEEVALACGRGPGSLLAEVVADRCGVDHVDDQQAFLSRTLFADAPQLALDTDRFELVLVDTDHNQRQGAMAVDPAGGWLVAPRLHNTGEHGNVMLHEPQICVEDGDEFCINDVGMTAGVALDGGLLWTGALDGGRWRYTTPTGTEPHHLISEIDGRVPLEPDRVARAIPLTFADRDGTLWVRSWRGDWSVFPLPPEYDFAFSAFQLDDGRIPVSFIHRETAADRQMGFGLLDVQARRLDLPGGCPLRPASSIASDGHEVYVRNHHTVEVYEIRR